MGVTTTGTAERVGIVAAGLGILLVGAAMLLAAGTWAHAEWRSAHSEGALPTRVQVVRKFRPPEKGWCAFDLGGSEPIPDACECRPYEDLPAHMVPKGRRTALAR